MKKAIVLTATFVLTTAGLTFASEELAKKSGCMNCHDMSAKKVGPSFKDIAKKHKVDVHEWGGITMELPDRPGALADMARALEDKQINIGSLLVVGTHADAAIVLVGVPHDREDEARQALIDAKFFVYDDEHGHATATF